MLFNSFGFLAFFAVLTLVYYAIAHRYRWMLLVAASFSFYASFQPAYLVLLAAPTAMAYASGLAIAGSVGRSRRRALFAGSVTAIGAALLVFKYYDFGAEALDALAAGAALRLSPLLPRLNLAAGAGLSFYTLSCVSYVVDVYRGSLAPERHAGYFTLYVSFFPKLLAGPIERAKPFLARVREPVPFDGARVTAGLQLMLWGLFKKVVIADRLSGLVDAAYRQPDFASPADLVLATYFFAFQLYCDFSGYTDIAIGASKVLGFDLVENFRRPFFSTSVPEFWARRWHLSLTAWFKDYLYVPLGGNRRSRARVYLNQLVVFLVSGLWHGANWTFLIWGGLNGLYQVVSLMTSTAWARLGLRTLLPPVAGALVRGLVTFHLILFTWVFFRAASLADAATILSRVAGSARPLPALLWARLTRGDLLLSLALIGVLIVIDALDEAKPFWARVQVKPAYVRWSVYYAMLFGLIVLGTWKLQQFVYMQF